MAASSGRASMCDLPPEILLRIFYRLDIDELLALSSSCRYLNYVTGDVKLWDNLCRRYNSSADIIMSPGWSSRNVLRAVYPFRCYLGYWRLRDVPILMRIHYDVAKGCIGSVYTSFCQQVRNSPTCSHARLRKIGLRIRHSLSLWGLLGQDGPRRLLSYPLLKVCQIKEIPSKAYFYRYYPPTVASVPRSLLCWLDYLPQPGIYIDTPALNDSELFSVSYHTSDDGLSIPQLRASYVTGNIFTQADTVGFFAELSTSFALSVTEQLDWGLLKAADALDCEPHPQSFVVPPDCLVETDGALLPDLLLSRYRATDRQYLDPYKTTYAVHLLVFSPDRFALLYIHRRYLVAFCRVTDDQLATLPDAISIVVDD